MNTPIKSDWNGWASIAEAFETILKILKLNNGALLATIAKHTRTWNFQHLHSNKKEKDATSSNFGKILLWIYILNLYFLSPLL